MSKNPGLVDQSYKILFILYAPIGVITFLIKAYIKLDIDYLPLTAVITSLLSVVIAVVIVVTGFFSREKLRQDPELHIPLILRHRFLILYVLMAVISLNISLFYVYQKYREDVHLIASSQQGAVEIVALVHITNELGKYWQDTQQLMQGLGMFVMNKPQMTERYHFSFFDHKNRFDDALKARVVKEIKLGVNYFICTASAACSPLAEQFDTLSKLARPKGQRPVLIITATATSALKTKSHQVYRFYPRNQETVALLVKMAKKRGFKEASYIAINDANGRDAVNLFIDQWGGEGREIVPGLYLDPLLSERRAAEKIDAFFSQIEAPEVVFVAHYKNITDGLLTLDDKTTLLVTASFLDKFSNDRLDKVIQSDRWISVMPDYKDQQALFDQLPPSFFYLTLDKLTNAIDQAQGNPEAFHSAWMASDYPAVLNFERDGEADFKIHMKPRSYRQGTMTPGSSKKVMNESTVQ